MELRPEWDAALGIFRMPVTLSLGFDDVFRIFAGPAFILGDPVLGRGEGSRRYTGGNAWLGEAGITVAPFSFQAGPGTISIYGELAWRSFLKADDLEFNWVADFGAASRISTGVRYTWGL
jgi:hypothetical protein